MTSQSPRIYTYKITFEEVLYYYYGVHKENKFGEYYMGSPITHKWIWNFYTPKKQILEVFDYTDEGWIKAQEIEKRLIKPFYNTDKWCLNESCGGLISLNIARKIGVENVEKKRGIFAQTPEQRSEWGKRTKELKLGIFGLTPEQRSENSRKAGSIGGKIGGKTNAKNKTGVCGRSKEQMTKDSRKGGLKLKELGIGVHAIPKEIKSEMGRNNMKNLNKQKWKCTETGFVSNSGALTNYQKAKNIDTSKRVRIS
jgi:hypothetical protein